MAYRTNAVVPTLLLLCFTVATSVLPSYAGNNNEKYQLREIPGVGTDDHQAVSPPSITINNNPPTSAIIDTAKTLFCPLSTTTSRFALLRAAASNSWTWIKLNTKLLLLFKQSQDCSSSAPSLESQANAPEIANGGTGAVNVKEAILKSLNQGAVVIDNSARSAAKLAGDVMDATTKKLQETLGTQSDQASSS